MSTITKHQTHPPHPQVVGALHLSFKRPQENHHENSTITRARLEREHDDDEDTDDVKLHLSHDLHEYAAVVMFSDVGNTATVICAVAAAFNS